MLENVSHDFKTHTEAHLKQREELNFTCRADDYRKAEPPSD